MEYDITEAQIEDSGASAISSVKSLNGRYCLELQKSYGIAPAISRSIASCAESVYNPDRIALESGQMKYMAVSSDEPAGKPLTDCRIVEVVLTIYRLSDDRFKNQVEKKMCVLERISRECYDLGGCLTIEDASKIMLTDERTIKRYTKSLKNNGVVLPLRGCVQCTGRGQTHKADILDHYLSGKMPDEIQRLTHHSIDAICRYISDFSRVANCYFYQEMTFAEISNVVRITQSVVEQYIVLFKKHYATSDRLTLILEPKALDNEMLRLKKTQKQGVEIWLNK